MTDSQLEQVQRITRRRMLFSAIHLVLYFSFGLNWTSWNEILTRTVGTGPITGSIVMFVALVLTFVAMEFLFLMLNRERSPQ